MKNLPNILTLSRVILLPLLLFMILSSNFQLNMYSVVLFIAISFTDFLDGFIARNQGSTSDFGKMLDPIADKLLVAAVILILTSKEIIADWETIPALIILLREIAVSGLREYLAKIKVSVPVSRISKIKTSLQLIALAFLILSESGITTIPILSIGKMALWIAGILTLYTGYDYLKSGLKHF